MAVPPPEADHVGLPPDSDIEPLTSEDAVSEGAAGEGGETADAAEAEFHGDPVNLRFPFYIAIGIGLIALALTGWLDHVLMGYFILLGLFLGIGNMWIAQKSIVRITAEDNPRKKLLAMSMMGRLALLTCIALVIGFLVKPEGLGVFVGLAISQVVLVLTTTVPVLKGLRQQS